MTSAQKYSASGALQGYSTSAYDVLDNRVVFQVDTDGNGPEALKSTRTIYAGAQVYADYSTTNNALPNSTQPTRRYLHGAGVDEMLGYTDTAGNSNWTLTNSWCEANVSCTQLVRMPFSVAQKRRE